MLLATTAMVATVPTCAYATGNDEPTTTVTPDLGTPPVDQVQTGERDERNQTELVVVVRATAGKSARRSHR